MPLYGWTRVTSHDLAEPLSFAGCDRFSAGTGHTYGFELVSEVPFWGDVSTWSFGPLIFFRHHALSENWYQTAASSDGEGNVVSYQIRHQLDGATTEAGLGGRFNFDLMPKLRLSAALTAGYQWHATYERSLHLVAPDPSRVVSLSSGAADTTQGSGFLPASSTNRILPSFELGLSTELPLSRTLRVQPSVLARLPLLGLTRNWRELGIEAGMAFLFDLTPRFETVPVYVKREVADTIRAIAQAPLPSPLKAAIEAVAIDRNGEETKVLQMRIEEVKTRNAYPILNYIFFPEGSAAIPSRYVQYATHEEALRKFRGASDRSNVKLLDLYHETLNILGDRLSHDAQAHVTLLASTSNTGIEANDLELARRRGEAVKQYLTTIWKIEPARIVVQSSLLPKNPSPVTTREGQEENRRVEIAVDDDRVLEPVEVTNLEHLATPDRIRLKPTIETRSPIMSTYASIRAGDVELQSFTGEGQKKIWAPTEDMLSRIHDSLSVDYVVRDSAGDTARAHTSIPLNVTRLSSDREERVERYSLILFGFDQAKIGPRNEAEIRKVAGLLPKLSAERILVQGYTDETGDVSHNDALSLERAQAVTRSIESVLASSHEQLAARILTEGRGSRDLLYDNRLPEGRFFSRTVNITVERSLNDHGE